MSGYRGNLISKLPGQTELRISSMDLTFEHLNVWTLSLMVTWEMANLSSCHDREIKITRFRINLIWFKTVCIFLTNIYIYTSCFQAGFLSVLRIFVILNLVFISCCFPVSVWSFLRPLLIPNSQFFLIYCEKDTLLYRKGQDSGHDSNASLY